MTAIDAEFMTERPAESATTWETPSAEATEALGLALGQACTGGEVIALTGALGSGKTCLVRGVAAGLGVPAKQVASPTFALIHEYQGRVPVYHVDLFRLDPVDAVQSLGLEEYTESPAVTLIEWAEKAPRALPDDHLWITFQSQDGESRRIALHARGPRHERLIERVVHLHPERTWTPRT